MRGESDRECRARGGGVVLRRQGLGAAQDLQGQQELAQQRLDASLKRGAGPLFRKRGGRLPEAFKEHEGDPRLRDRRRDSGGGSKPSMGRAGRKTGGGVGADLNPLTHPQTPKKPKGYKIMGEGEKIP